MKVTTWNVNGIRAREAQVREWIERERPDVLCLQELKAPVAQLPAALCELPGYWCYWHAETSYSGVGLHLRQEIFPDKPVFGHPAFDHENRIVTAQVGSLVVASVYVPNGGMAAEGRCQAPRSCLATKPSSRSIRRPRRCT